MKALIKIMISLFFVFLAGCGGKNTQSGLDKGINSNLVNAGKYFVYVANYTDNTISSFSMSGETGALTPIETTSSGSGGNPISLAVSPSKDKLYVAKANSSNFQIFSINKINGALVPFQTIQSNDNGQSSVSASSDGRFVYVTSYNGVGNIFSVSSLTGQLSQLKNLESISQKAYLHPSGELALLMSGSGITFWPINKVTGDITISGGAYTVIFIYFNGHSLKQHNGFVQHTLSDSYIQVKNAVS